jgi:hypothetical protein
VSAAAEDESAATESGATDVFRPRRDSSVLIVCCSAADFSGEEVGSKAEPPVSFQHG